MNDHSDIERVLATWFDDGPSTMPDRVVDVVADRIGRQSQRRAWRLDWRPIDMTTTFKLAAAAVAVAIVAILGYNLLPGSSSVGGPGPTASPGPTPSPTAAPTPRPMRSGVLDAGTYVTRPFGSDLSLTFTVPDGWQGFPDWALLGPKGTEAPAGVGIGFLMAADLYSDPCHPGFDADVPVGPTVDDLVDALAANRGYEASTASDVELSGFSGKRLDLRLPDDLSSCIGDFLVWDASPIGGSTLYAQGPGAIWRLWILDVGGARVIIVLDDYAGTPAQDRDQAQAIVDSIVIEP